MNQRLIVMAFQLMLALIVLIPFVMGAIAFKGMIADFEQTITERTTVSVTR